jgi:hypothetical protein
LAHRVPTATISIGDDASYQQVLERIGEIFPSGIVDTIYVPRTAAKESSNPEVWVLFHPSIEQPAFRQNAFAEFETRVQHKVTYNARPLQMQSFLRAHLNVVSMGYDPQTDKWKTGRMLQSLQGLVKNSSPADLRFIKPMVDGDWPQALEALRKMGKSAVRKDTRKGKRERQAEGEIFIGPMGPPLPSAKHKATAGGTASILKGSNSGSIPETRMIPP